VRVTGPGHHYAPLTTRREVDAHLLLPLQVARDAASKVRQGGTDQLEARREQLRTTLPIGASSARPTSPSCRPLDDKHNSDRRDLRHRWRPAPRRAVSSERGQDIVHLEKPELTMIFVDQALSPAPGEAVLHPRRVEQGSESVDLILHSPRQLTSHLTSSKSLAPSRPNWSAGVSNRRPPPAHRPAGTGGNAATASFHPSGTPTSMNSAMHRAPTSAFRRARR
jgi:hypothetical protein